MADYLIIHPHDPQPRLVSQVVAALRDGALIAYPTDSSYAFGCHIGDKPAMDRIHAIRRFGKHHQYSLLCRELAEVAQYAKMNNQVFRMVKSLSPGPYTFVLPALHIVPRRLQNQRRKTIGVRLPDHPVAQAVVDALGEPLMTVTAMAPGRDRPFNDPEEIREELGHLLDVIVNGGHCGIEPTTVLDLAHDPISVIRHGKGPVDQLGL